MSPSSSAASSGQPAKRRGSGSQADDDTKPHAFDAETKPHRFAPSESTETNVTLDKDERPGSWPSAERRETVHAEPPPNSPYAAVAAYGAAAGPAAGHHPGFSAGGTTVAPPASSASRASVARRARLKVAHLGPLSVMRVSLTFSLCMFIVLLVAVAALWGVLDSSGVFKSIEDAANTLTDKNRSGIADWLGFGRVMLITVVLGAANVIAVTLLSTIGALLYNLCSDFVGGVEVTLVER